METSKQFSDMSWFAEQMPGGFFIYSADETQGMIYINKAALQIFACDTLDEFKELTGYTFKGILHPEDKERVIHSIQSQISDKENENRDYVEYRIIDKNGAVHWIDDYGHFAELPGYGKVFYVFISDITDKKNAQQDNHLALQVIDGLSVSYSCIYLLNLKSGHMRTYHLANEFFQSISEDIGMGTEQSYDWYRVMEKYAQNYILPEDRRLFLKEVSYENIHCKLADTDCFSVIYRCRTSEEGIVYVSMSVIRTSEYEKEGSIVLAFRNVTEETLSVQHELQNKLKTQMELEREKHTNEIKSQFLFNVSHDIRTPMNAILGFSGLAKKHQHDPEKMTDYLNKVEEAGEQLLKMIDNLLDMSNLEFDHLDLKSEPCKLAEELNLVIDLFRRQAEEKHLTLTVEIDLPEESVLIDASRFSRMMSNLLSNAVKFTPSNGSIKVSARKKQTSESGYARYEFSVSDTGVGMSEEFMKHMFQAFEQEHSSTRTGTTGTGLGLSIVKGLADLMGGSVSVESKKSVGTTFTLSLPLKLSDITGKETPLKTKSAEHHAEDNYRVLLVEDIEINRILAETILKESGFSVDSVPDGCDAVEAIKNTPEWYYDIVLMDIQMPVMNGYEATRAIRAIRRKDIPSLPIIALSANAREKDKCMSFESGMNDHVAKPFDAANLIATINEYVEERKKGVDALLKR